MDKASYIRQRAAQLGLDPQVVLDIASGEGGFSGAIGDHGTSFGPFQMHMGGALPGWVSARGSAYAQQWANSKAGIDYALRQIAGVARGKRGEAARQAIVLRFERPADPSHDLAARYMNGGPHFGGYQQPGTFQGDLLPSPHAQGQKAQFVNKRQPPPQLQVNFPDVKVNLQNQLPELSPLLNNAMNQPFIAPYKQAASTWQMIANQPSASPETLLYAQNAQVVAGARPNT